MLRTSYANVVQNNNTNNHNSAGVGTSNHSTTIPNEVDAIVMNNHLQNDRESVSSHDFITNNSHPLYLHNNDHPGLVLIAKKLTGPDNYAPWSRSMQIALNARNKFVFVNGGFEKPDEHSSVLAQWERVNDLVITWILNSVVDEISDSLNYVTSAREVWLELKERFSGINGHRIYQVMKDIHSLEQGSTSVEVYFHRLKGLWDEYAVLEPSVNCTCGAHKVQIDRDQNRRLLQFLMGLHESNANVRGQILLMTPLPSVSQAYAFVKQDEKARQGFSNNPVSNPFAHSVVAAMDTGPYVSKPQTSATNKISFSQPNAIDGSNRKSVKCSHCNFTGHTKENCYKLIGYPPNWKKKEKPSSQKVTQFRNLPTANQVAAVNTSTQNGNSNIQMSQMQQQINQLSQMVNMFVGNSKKMASPEEHIADVTGDEDFVAELDKTKTKSLRHGFPKSFLCLLNGSSIKHPVTKGQLLQTLL